LEARRAIDEDAVIEIVYVREPPKAFIGEREECSRLAPPGSRGRVRLMPSGDVKKW
jgi:hypothetical protein